MFSLKPPRHIPTLPKCEILCASRCFPLLLQTQTLLDAVGTSHLCQERSSPPCLGRLDRLAIRILLQGSLIVYFRAEL